MNAMSMAGFALASAIAPAYVAIPRVQAVMIGGSVSLGHADAYSDLEIGVFWADALSAVERKTAIQRVGGELWSFDRSFRALSSTV